MDVNEWLLMLLLYASAIQYCDILKVVAGAKHPSVKPASSWSDGQPKGRNQGHAQHQYRERQQQQQQQQVYDGWTRDGSAPASSSSSSSSSSSFSSSTSYSTPNNAPSSAVRNVGYDIHIKNKVRRTRMYRKSRASPPNAELRPPIDPAQDLKDASPRSSIGGVADGARVGIVGRGGVGDSGSTANSIRGSSLTRRAARDTLVEIRDEIEEKRVCRDSTGVTTASNQLPDSLQDRFEAQMHSAVKTANVLNNLFTAADAQHNSVYNDAFYYSLLRALIQDDAMLHGAAVAFDRFQYHGGASSATASGSVPFCPYVYKNKTSGNTQSMNLAATTKEKYSVIGSEGYDWYWRQRPANFSPLLWPHMKICPTRAHNDTAAGSKNNISPLVSRISEGFWTKPYVDCDRGRAWIVTFSVPFFGCNISGQDLSAPHFKGVIAVDIDMEKIDINQCDNVDGEKPDVLFSATHNCRDTTKCVFVAGHGFKRGGYKCECAAGYYFPAALNSDARYFNGSEVERKYARRKLSSHRSASGSSASSSSAHLADKDYKCLRCASGCLECENDTRCFVEYDVMFRGIPLGIESFCMTISLVIGFIIVRLRKTKVMKATMWGMLEIIIFGALLLYSTVVIQYFEPSNHGCLLIPWFREVGFSIVYGALILKIYRVLAEFQSRKAHRVHVRDKDLLKYLSLIVLIVIGYMAAWTAVNLDHVREGVSLLEVGETNSLKYNICKSQWWDYVVELGEFIFLCFGIYLCYCTRAAPSDYLERRYISWAIYIETVISALFHIIRHFLWLVIHPDYIFLMYFLRCQFTVSTTLILVLGPKLWYAHRPPDDDHFRNRAYSTSDVHDSILPESMKLHVGVSSNGDVDVGEINLSEMDPDDIRAELKRLYTQLQIYKTKTMRKDNPHISKRRGGRKQTHRRFSLQAFHHKHKHHHSTTSEHDHDHEMSKTPEESTNSAEGVGYSIEESTCSVGEMRTPTVTFKPGHKTSLY